MGAQVRLGSVTAIHRRIHCIHKSVLLPSGLLVSVHATDLYVLLSQLWALFRQNGPQASQVIKSTLCVVLVLQAGDSRPKRGLGGERSVRGPPKHL